jgi:23S rRNA pseudouridine1911/1915/1917 synthase
VDSGGGNPIPAIPAIRGNVVAADKAGETLAALVREIAPGTSWSKARELCQSGRVWVDGERATDPARRVAAGERIELRTEAPALHREPVPLDAVIHLDADVVVVRKPAGLLTVPFEKEDRETLLSLTRVAVRRLESARGHGHNPSLRAVQRLDKDTSGLVVFARNVRAQRHLQEQLGEHEVARRYLALVHGAAEDAIYDTLLVPDRGDGRRGSWGVFRPAEADTAAPPASARNATTHVTVLERLRRATLVACELETGRQHQIRIHLAEAGHPLLGETVYVRGWRGPLLEASRLMLHAGTLGFVHPRSNRPVRFEDPPPADFAAMLKLLRSPRVKP